MRNETVQEQLQMYIADIFPNKEAPRVSELTNISAGWESDIHAFTLTHGNGACLRREEMILRIYQGDDAHAKSAREFNGMQWLYRAGYPVPQVLVLERESSPVNKPIVLMERINGGMLWPKDWEKEMVDIKGGISGHLDHDIPQYKLWQILFMFAWPAVWFSFLIYIVGRQFIPESGITPTWVILAVTVLGTGAELAVGLVLLRREGYSLTFASLRDRIRWKWPKGWQAWLIAVGVLVAGMALSVMMGGANRVLASVPGFMPPAWWPAAGNPTVQISSAADAFPDMTLQGNFLFVLVNFVIGLVFNVFGEELYYRGFLMPKMRSVFGSWDWVANGVLFTLKHVYQRWLYPGILVGGLGFAFTFGVLGSLPLAMIFHWIGNFLFQTVFLVMAAFGLG